MRFIFENCTLWEKEMCNKANLVNLHRQTVGNGNQFEGLDEEGIQKYNKICSECVFPLAIEERKCPVCGNEKLSTEVTKFQNGMSLVYNYNCNVCQRILYSSTKLD